MMRLLKLRWHRVSPRLARTHGYQSDDVYQNDAAFMAAIDPLRRYDPAFEATLCEQPKTEAEH